MSEFFTEIKETLFPKPDSRDGPLPPLLLGLTVVTGLVDSFSFLALSRVFVANMTGNVVFLAFALAGAKGFSVAYSILAIAAFLLGSTTAGKLHARMGERRGHLLGSSSALKTVLVGIAALIALLAPRPIPSVYGYGLIICLGFSMGIQNATARKLAVPDLTTTVLTMTITGIGADSRVSGGKGSKLGRRLISILAMFSGALIGALLILYVSIPYPLLIAFTIIAIVTVASTVASRGNPAWNLPPK